MSSSPLDGFETRSLRQLDAAAASELVQAFDAAYLEEPTDRLSKQDVLDWWLLHDLERGSMGLWRGESLAAFGLLRERAGGVLELQAFVDPNRTGRGLGSFLLGWAEEWVGADGTLRAEVLPGDEAGRRLVESRGYRHVRSGYRMVIDFDEPPPEAQWPEGFSVATLGPDEERLLYEIMEEAFAEEWGRPQYSFEDWRDRIFLADFFDSSLCFLVREAGEVVAGETCAQRFGMGLIGSIGVLKPWRRRGLGRALLLQGFGELYRRGERRIGLGVDAENPTGATRLYETVGMRVAWQADTYEKAL